MKKIGFLSFGFWNEGAGSLVRTARDSLVQSVELAVAAQEIGIAGAFYRVHHFASQQASPFVVMAAVAAKTTTLEMGTGVIDMRYETPLYLAEQAAQLDLLSEGRLQLGISRGSPESVQAGYRHFGHEPAGSDADMARAHTDRFLRAIEGAPIALPDLQAPGPRPAAGGPVPITPQSPGLRQRVWWGAGSLGTAQWAATQGMQLMSSTLLLEDRGIPFDRLQREQVDAFRAGWAGAGWSWPSRVSVSRSIVPLVDDTTRAYFGRGRRGSEGVGQIEGVTARFGPSFVGEPEELVARLRQDAAVEAADMVLVTVPNLLGVDFNARLLQGVHEIGRELGWND
ncbi:MAG TPA: LLM class flavin-dependent oxidoreductase [Microbacteriaceae bacterium]|nr:LLM class flavin-dependent oxidoreductase [Microbacteriaceae bacterium]